MHFVLQYSAAAERDAADDYNENSMGTNTFSYDSFGDQQATKEDTGDMSFCMSNYPKDAMKMMSMMRSHHMLTDVVLEVQKELFHAHKVILSAASPYFKAMFTGGLKECEMSRVKLEGVRMHVHWILVMNLFDFFVFVLGMSVSDGSNFVFHVFGAHSRYGIVCVPIITCSHNVPSYKCY